MNSWPTLAASRPIAVARELSGEPLDADLVYSRKVILTGERSTLEHANGRWCFINCLRLLSRVVGCLEVVLPCGMAAFDAAHLRALAPVDGAGAAVYLEDVAARFRKAESLLTDPAQKKLAAQRAVEAEATAASAK